MLSVLRERLQVINPRLENDQVDEVVKRLTASFPGTGLLENNRHVFNLLLENTSVSRNRQTGENSPTVRFIDFDDRGNNRFIAVCQFRVQVPGTGGHIIPDIVLFLNGLPVVVIVTDRTQLERQLSETSLNIGFTVKVADSIQRLKELLRGDTSDLVMAMIHKFRDVDLQETFPELNPSPHILVMTDEAHRSQYRLLGANLDRAIPNATKIGYTGTPIEKTERIFGDYIDKYTLRQSIEDGVTLQIVYEGRTHKAGVPDQAAMDTAFEDVFSDYDLKRAAVDPGGRGRRGRAGIGAGGTPAFPGGFIP